MKLTSTSDHRPSWDETWLMMAIVISKRSRCTKAQVGAVVVDLEQNVISSSYNGPPRGMDVEGMCTNWCARSRGESLDPGYTDCPSVHAEANAIARADFSRMSQATMYISTSPCLNCAKQLANSGITRICYIDEAGREYRNVETTLDFLNKCDIEVQTFSPPRMFSGE